MAGGQSTVEAVVMAVDLATGQSLEALRGRHVFLTGHTGFKGAWLTTMLHTLGCRVSGFSLPPEAANALFSQLALADSMAGNTFGDIRDAASLRHALAVAAPEIVLHLAAQSLVRRSYSDAQGTWATNVMGTVNLLEAVRQCPSVKAVLVVTTDKCYDNKEWAWGYREVDALGGHDPYSASKAGAELVAQSYRKSFFESSGVLLATARAGNVIGGDCFRMLRVRCSPIGPSSSGIPTPRDPGNMCWIA
jgi:CDP-glucose 4,6-dehydratase